MRYETEGLQFFASRPEHQKGLNNIVDMWKDFNLGMLICAQYLYQ